LERYAEQTCLPNEVSISLSACKELDRHAIRELEQAPWPFSLKMFLHKENKTAGENRNWARMQASGDILICQDADDLPHPQRVEIVKYIFEHFDVEHLIHSWAEGGHFLPYHLSEIPLCRSNRLHIFEGFRQEDGSIIPLHNGNICLSREFARRSRWDPLDDGQEDVRFNYRACEISQKTYLTPLGLIHFISGRSYFRDYLKSPR
jgi:glycosyltransferase involved in cell wall biosynthesis